MKNFYDKFSFLLAFMIFIVFFNMMFGSKPTQYFLTLVLLGMVIVNADDFSNLIKDNLSNNKPKEKTTEEKAEEIEKTPQLGGTPDMYV